MNIRSKLIIPIGAMLVLSFAIFISYLVLDQTRKQGNNLKRNMETMANLVAMTNIPNVWNIDKPAMDANIKAFLKDEDIVGIKILGAQEDILAEASEPSDGGKPIVENIDIVRENEKIGRAEVSFTDQHIRAGIRALVDQVIVMGILVLVAMILILLYTASMITRPVMGLVIAVKDM